MAQELDETVILNPVPAWLPGRSDPILIPGMRSWDTFVQIGSLVPRNALIPRPPAVQNPIVPDPISIQSPSWEMDSFRTNGKSYESIPIDESSEMLELILKNVQCYVCGGRDHFVNACSQLGMDPSAKCTVCNYSGHTSLHHEYIGGRSEDDAFQSVFLHEDLF